MSEERLYTIEWKYTKIEGSWQCSHIHPVTALECEQKLAALIRANPEKTYRFRVTCDEDIPF